MDLSFIYDYQIITALLAVGAIFLSGLTFVITRLKMNKSEQIKLVHEILIMYFTLFDKYRSYIEKYGKNPENEYIKTAYIGLLDPLEFYAHLSEKRQIGKEFDAILMPYFKGAHDVYHIHKRDIKPHCYLKVKRFWKKMGLCDNEVKDLSINP